jgi:hypothetical protein
MAKKTLLLALSLLGLARDAGAADTAAVDEAPDCAAPPSERAPDPRCGERLDGRPPEAPASAGVKAGRAALWLPKELGLIAVWPLVEGADLLEHHNVSGWYQAVLTSDDGLVGVRPEFNFTTGFAPTLGARFFDRRLLPGAGSQLAARFVTAGEPVVFGEVTVDPPTATGLTFTASYDHRRDRLFAGNGPNTKSELDAEGLGLGRFGSNIEKVHGGWIRRLPLHLRLLAHADVQKRDYEADHVRGGPSVAELYGLPGAECAALGLSVPCVNVAEMPGFYQGLRVVHAGVGLGVDERSRFRGASGVNAVADATSGWGILGDQTRDLRFSGEAVGALAGVDRMLMLRLWAGMVEPLNGTYLPFDELISPCGNYGMRGFPDGRFRGESGAFGTLEYRYYIAWSMDASIFTDVGTVAGNRFDGLLTNHWFPDVGVGLRFYNPSGAHWNVLSQGGVQFTWTPDYGFRLLLASAAF